MIDPIVQEVRDARAAIAAEFDYDLGKYIAWLREQTDARRATLANPKANDSQQATPRAPRSAVGHKPRVRPTAARA
jgi:hypothetical protein